MNYHDSTPFLAAVAVLLLWLQAASALTLRQTSLEELTLSSSLVVVGRVVDLRYEWTDANRQAIYTVLTVAVNQALKGQAGHTITVRQLGGQIGEFGHHVDGTPQFEPGEEVVFFLEEHLGSYWIHSIALGAYTLVKETGGKFVLRNLGDINLVAEDSRPVAPEEAYTRMPLEAFVSLVRAYVKP